MIRQHPRLPKLDNLPNELRDYLQKQNEWMSDVYAMLRNMDIGLVKISSGSSAPTGGTDGDLYIRKNGATSQLYLNINGTFSGYNNP